MQLLLKCQLALMPKLADLLHARILQSKELVKEGPAG